MTEVQHQRQAEICQQAVPAGRLSEQVTGGWIFAYHEGYQGPPISLTMPVRRDVYHFPGLPPVLEGLLPEGPQLESLLRTHKIDREDTFRQLVTVGADTVGSLTIEEITAPETGA